MQAFWRNVVHRQTSGADGILESALAACARKPSQDDIKLFQSMGVLPSTYDTLTRVKVVQIMSVLNRVFGQVGDKSWGLSPSPDPVLPTDAMTGIVLKYAQEGLQLAQAKNVTDKQTLADYASAALRANEKQIAKDVLAVAEERCERLERKVDDILLEARFTVDIIRQFISNLTRYGTALIIGPCEVPTVRMTLRGDGDTVSYRPEIDSVLRFMVPDTMDVYPAPGAIMPNETDLCLRVRYTKDELARAAESKSANGWRPDMIRQILRQYKGIDIGTQTITDRFQKSANFGEVPNTTQKYEGVRWFGLATGAELREQGIVSDGIGEIFDESYYEAEAVVLANRVIYAKVCDPAVGRPVVKTTFYGDTAQFFGWPPALQIDNCQKLMNLMMAALKKQLQLLGLTPLMVNGYSDFADADKVGAFSLSPGKVFLRNANAFAQGGQQGAAIQPLQLPNIIREIIALFESIAKLTDDASGFNRNMLGSGNFSGAARTASGLMQIQEAASIIATFVIGNIDATAIVPLLDKVVAWVNRNGKDKRCKGDAQIVARGQLSKVMKAAHQQVISAGFQATQGGVMPQLLGPEKLLVAFREYLKGIDFPNADKIIPDEERMAWLASLSDAEQSAKVLQAASQVGQGGQPSQTQVAPVSGQPEQAQPQQAQKQAGLGMPSGVEARRGSA